MLALQIITAAVIFLDRILLSNTPLAPACAVFMVFCILNAAGWVFRDRRSGAFLAFLKVIFCLFLLPYEPSPVILLPVIIMEVPGFLPEVFSHPAAWILFSPVAAAPAFLSGGRLRLVALGLWACSVTAGIALQWISLRSARLKSRIASLEKELTDADARRVFLEKMGAGEELLITWRERDRIAQNLHDELGHTITGSIMQLDAADDLFAENPARAREITSRVSETLKSGLSAIRQSLKAIKPEAERLGLQKIQSMLTRFEATYSRKTRLETTGNLASIPAPLWQVAEMNLQEALTNLLRHSSARVFICRISVLNGVYKFEFFDDGMVKSPVRSGMGLGGMEARTRDAGGTMILDVSRGFSIIMLFRKGGSVHGNQAAHRG